MAIVARAASAISSKESELIFFKIKDLVIVMT
jgi:hypothetical protein